MIGHVHAAVAECKKGLDGPSNGSSERTRVEAAGAEVVITNVGNLSPIFQEFGALRARNAFIASSDLDAFVIQRVADLFQANFHDQNAGA